MYKISKLNSTLKKVWTERWTRLLGWTKVVIGFGIAGVQEISQLAVSPDVKAELLKLDVPYIGLGLAILGFIVLASMEHKDA